MKRLNDSKISMVLIVFAAAIALGGSAYADFTFGGPVNLESVIPVLDGTVDCIDCFSTDGLEMYIESVRSGGKGSWDLWVLRRDSIGDAWSAPENLGPTVNTSNVESTASISADGLTLYFNSNRSGGIGNSDIYMTTRVTKNAPWGPSINLGPKINSSVSDAFPWVSTDGLELYFSSLRTGGYGSADIYVARRDTPNDPWGNAVNVGPVVNSAYTEGAVSLSPDGLLLLFNDQYVNVAVHRPGGYGNCDMWMSRRASVSEPWQMPVNLGPKVNGPDLDSTPRISLDGGTLYFGTTSDNWQAPIIPIVDFNSDGNVDGKEVLAMVKYWGQNEPLCDIGPFAWGDGIVDLNDLIVLAEYIGKEVVDPSLIAHWELDEGAGSVAIDWVGGHDALIVGNAVWDPNGKVGGALTFDGTTNFARTMSPVLDPAKGPFSVVVWIKGGSAGKVIVSQASGEDWLYLNGSGMLTTDLKSLGNDGVSLTSDAYILDDQWHRVAIVWDGTNRALHMDGIEVARDTQSALAGSSGNLQIGTGKDCATTTFWFGLIDDVRIYDRVINP
jgi:hypothetical protein